MKPKKPILLLLLLLFCCNYISAQTAHSCGTLESISDAKSQDVERQILNYYNSIKQRSGEDTLVIPVVFHVVHFLNDTIIGQGSNVSDSLIHLVLNQTNDVLRNRGASYKANGMDLRIELKMATITSCGEPFNGIHRIGGNSAASPKIAREHSYNPKEYLNVYLVNSIFLGGVSYNGFSSFPENHGNSNDVIYLTTQSLGYPSTVKYLFAHELGHYFGLYHTYTDGCKNDSCWIDGDKVCDTPPENSLLPNCDTIVNTCTSDQFDTSLLNPFRAISLGGLGEQNDLKNNIMDYSLNCFETFTPGQKNRMRAVLETTRVSLQFTRAFDLPCATIICPSFDNSLYNYPSGDILMNDNQFIVFTNTTTTGNKTEWFLNDSLYSTNNIFTWVADTAGDLVIKLCVTDTSNGCSNCYSRNLKVLCSVNPIIETIPDTAIVGDSINLKYKIQVYPNGKTVKWNIDGDSISNYPWIKHAFEKTGWHIIKFQMSNSNCTKYTLDSIFIVCDTTSILSIENKKDSIGLNKIETMQILTNLDTSDWYASIEKGIIISRTDSSLEYMVGKEGYAIMSIYSTKCKGYVLDSFGVQVLDLTTKILNMHTLKAMVYPNPVSNILHIKPEFNSQYGLNLYNAIGQHVLNKVNLQGDQSMDLSTLPQGVYTIILKSESKVSSYKLVKKTMD